MTTIITKNSSTASAVPLAADLVQGELAVNVTDKRLFTQNASDVVVELGTNPSSVTTASATITGGTVNGTSVGASTPSTGAFTTLSASGNVTLGDASTDTLNVGNGGLVKDASGNLGIGTTSPVQKLHVAGNVYMTGDTFRIKNSASNTSFIRTEENASTAAYTYATMDGRSTGYWAFSTNDTERARIDSSGNLLVGTTSAIGAGLVGVKFDGSAKNGIQVQTTWATTGSGFAYFSNSAGTTCGTITQNGTTTVAYNTSSDYRLKENIAPMSGALSVIQQLKPVTYNWKADGSAGQGFIAHELQEVVPDCVTGEKDAIDVDGNPRYQGIDTSFLVATLTAAIQEQQAMIEQLKADVVALKGN